MRLTYVAALALFCALPMQAHAQGGPTIGNDRAPVGAQVLTRDPGPATPVTRNRYIITAQRFHAHDETGPDWPGSDEVYLVFEDAASGQRRFTRTYGDIDSGDTQSIHPTESCIGPLGEVILDSRNYPPATWTCIGPGLTGDIAFNITLYEADGWSPMACAAAPGVTPTKKNCDDDQIGSLNRRFTAAALRNLMPNVNDIHEETARLGGYSVTFRIQRLSDTTDAPRRRRQ